MLKKEEFKIVEDIKEIPTDFFNNNQSIERIIFKTIDFDTFKFNDSLIRNCTFQDCNFNSCIFDKIDFQRVDFTNCTFKFCDLSKDLRYITGKVVDCIIEECDLSTSFIQNTKWHSTIFNDVDFKKIKTKSIDFTDSEFLKINFDGSNIVRGNFSNVQGLSRSMFYDVFLDDCIFDWNEAFIIMEFNNNELENLYKYGIEEVLKQKDITPKRVDKYEFKGRITDEILQNIVTSKFVIAECSAANKNVFFEVGYALGNNKKIIFLVDKADNIPFDLKDFKFIIHNKSIDSLKEQLDKRVDFFLNIK